MKLMLALLLVAACADPIDARISKTPAPEPEPVLSTDLTSLDVLRDDQVQRYDVLPSAIQRGAARPQARVATPVDFRPLVADDARLGLLRIAGSEVEWSNDNDVVGIWQIARNVRARHCDNTRLPSRARMRITECERADGTKANPGPQGVIDNAEETHLSVLRRLSSRVMGVGAARHGRQRWIREVTPDCQEPESFPQSRSWARLEPLCREAVELVDALVSGQNQRRVTGRATPIAWGGRCEVETGACDDRRACTRGLARIQGTGTRNALWCRVGSRGCSAPIEVDGIIYSDAVCAGLNVPAPSHVREQAALSDDGPGDVG